MKKSDFMLEAKKYIPNEITYSQTYTDLGNGWFITVEKWEDDPKRMVIEFHISYNPNTVETIKSKRLRKFGLFGHKTKTSTDWVIGSAYRFW